MREFFYKRFLYIPILLFLIPVFIFVNQVLAFGRPQGVGYANPGFNRPNSQGDGYRSQQEGQAASAPAGQNGQPLQQSDSMQQQAVVHVPAFAQNHLQGRRLQACQRIEKVLVHRSTHLVGLATQMEKTFTSIAQGVERYYLTKVVPSGTTLPSYDSLVADIATRENTLTPLVVAAQSDVTGFSCTGNNPGALMTQYRTDMQAVLKGLEDYRTSIKNLIVAVRTLPSINSNGAPSATSSSSPAETSGVTPSVTLTP
ncbi:hypothetical protein M1615_05160 [Patescibacteria group bacterium]|nr:hypothetical protein [Patescibacteria group bacterium]MCL5010037.1 hypothetical protein [Patescibacteria group bacterium]